MLGTDDREVREGTGEEDGASSEPSSAMKSCMSGSMFAVWSVPVWDVQSVDRTDRGIHNNPDSIESTQSGKRCPITLRCPGVLIRWCPIVYYHQKQHIALLTRVKHMTRGEVQ